jgi:hypothetical protein
MHVTSLGAARESQEGIAVDPLLVGCGLKTHDFDPNEVWKIYFCEANFPTDAYIDGRWHSPEELSKFVVERLQIQP